MKKQIKAPQYINDGTDEQMEINGYRSSIIGTIITWICILLTFGFLRLVFYWKPEWMLKCTHKKCNLNVASKVLLKDKYEQWFVENVFELRNYLNEFINENQKSEVDHDSVKETLLSFSSIVRYFVNKRWKYIWNTDLNKFERLAGFDENFQIDFVHNCRGLTKEEQNNKRLFYGENSIRIHLTPIYVLFIREVLSPFYIFQIFSCTLWFYDDYVYYASCIVFLSTISIIFSLYSIRQNERALRDIIHRATTVTVFRRDNTKRGQYYEEEVPSENLVPGDIIAIKNMSIMQCDALLMNGNVIVNESMLTGESVPVTKIAYVHTPRPISTPNEYNQQIDSKLNIKEHSKNILFCGTQVIQTRYYEHEKVKAIVLRTGFNTTKGELVRSILHPKPVDFRFNVDTYKYIGALSAIAFTGMIFAIVIKTMKKNPVTDIVKRSLDLITIAVPPALPGALTAGLIYAQNRLRKQKIYCISPRTINICGSLNTFVFDKTGTLTEDGLDLKCVLPTKLIDNSKLQRYFDASINNVDEFKNDLKDLLEAMASCHSITRIHGELAGDPLDCKMFEFTKWELVEPTIEETKLFNMLVPTIVYPKTKFNSSGEFPYQIGIIRQFPFSSSLQRMSVIVRALDGEHFKLYCKGSPEKIAEMSMPESLPKDYQQILTSYTREGYRVIAIATKKLELNYVKLQRIEREKLEKDLEFLGLIIMENRLKPQTTPVINCLKAANIRTIMCTGDNILTALSVARDCDMIGEDERVVVIEANSGEPPQFTYAEIVKQKVKEIEFDPKSKTYQEKDKDSHFHFAVNGKSFAVIRNEHKDLLEKLAVRGAVFGRMSPEQKQQLIETLQDLGYYVGMCGDGANDCGALKAANAGISLSNAEASVASPFTSKNTNIECVPLMMREGRAALVTSFGIVKFICMYSITQFITVIILYTINAGITDMEFLYIDLILMTIIALFFSRTEAYPELYKKPPLNKLIAWRPISSLLGHMVIIIATQLFTFYYIKFQPWFEAYEDSEDKDVKNFASYENSALFSVSIFQYVTECIIFSKGAPYRRSIFSNYMFMIVLILSIILNALIALANIKGLNQFFTMRAINDTRFRFIIVAIAIIHFFIAFLFESYIIENDFLMNFTNDNEEKKSQIEDDTRKCYPKRTTNQMPYQKIENEIRQNKQWPPITANNSTTSFMNGNLSQNTNENARQDSFIRKSSRKRTNSHTYDETTHF